MADPVETPESTPAEAENTVPDSWDKIFEHPRFKQLNDRAKAAEDALEKVANDKEAAEEATLAEQQKWQELAVKRQSELDEAVGANKALELNMVRMRVGQKEGLPPELIGRLQGETEEEIAKDAQELAKLIPSTSGLPPTPKPDDSEIPIEERRQRAWKAHF